MLMRPHPPTKQRAAEIDAEAGNFSKGLRHLLIPAKIKLPTRKEEESPVGSGGGKLTFYFGVAYPGAADETVSKI